MSARGSSRGADASRDPGEWIARLFGFDMRGVDWLQYRLQGSNARSGIFGRGSTVSRRLIWNDGRLMRMTWLMACLIAVCAATPARADLRITRDHGGYVTEYKAKYERIRARHERVIIDGICNSACTMVFGIVPMNKICVTPRASLGFHQAYYDKAFTFGIKVLSPEGTSDLMAYYPSSVKDWIRRNGGLTPEMKKIKNGPELWKIVDPCPEDF